MKRQKDVYPIHKKKKPETPYEVTKVGKLELLDFPGKEELDTNRL